MMIRKISFLIFVLVMESPCYSQDGHVLYGDHPHGDMAIYIDANGFPYPDYFISNDFLKSCGSTLLNWYTANPGEFVNVAELYDLHFDKFSEEYVDSLNNTIYKSLVNRVNESNVKREPVTAMVHGYRKAFTSFNHDRCSPAEYDGLREILIKNGHRSAVYLEVYWDGMYGCCFSASAKKNRTLFEMFLEAQENAIPTGQQLRKILNGLETDTLHLISHSLGAKVLTHCLWDPLNIDIPTPEQSCVNICLIAPAISAEEVLRDHFNQRNTSFDSFWNDNYRVMIIYNEKDFVLRKKDFAIGLFGPGPYKYGDTSLGCNKRKSAENCRLYISKTTAKSSFQLFDFTETGKCHHLYCYCRNPLFRQVVNAMNGVSNY